MVMLLPVFCKLSMISKMFLVKRKEEGENEQKAVEEIIRKKKGMLRMMILKWKLRMKNHMKELTFKLKRTIYRS